MGAPWNFSEEWEEGKEDEDDQGSQNFKKRFLSEVKEKDLDLASTTPLGRAVSTEPGHITVYWGLIEDEKFIQKEYKSLMFQDVTIKKPGEGSYYIHFMDCQW